MKRNCLSVGLLFVLATLAAAAEPGGGKKKSEEGFVPMFNGKDLSEWEGAEEWWEVCDGAIVTQSTDEKPCPRTQYLYWKGGQPADFEMRCRFRISGDANTGVQFRSEKRPQWDTWGYQADIDTAGRYIGCLYQHGRGLVALRGQKVVFDKAGEKTVTAIGDMAELLKVVNEGEWNDYRIVAKGPQIALWLNGVLMCEVEDHEPKYALPKGIIAVQIHKGPPMKAEFKDLRIRVDK